MPPAKHRDRPGKIALSNENNAKFAVGDGEVWLEPDRLAESGDGLVELPLGSQGDCRGWSVTRRCPDPAGSPCGCAATASSNFPRDVQAGAKVRVRHGVARIQPDRVAVRGDGLIEITLPSQRVTEVGVRRGVVGLEPDRVAVCGDGLVEHALLREGDGRGCGELGQGSGLSRIAMRYSAIACSPLP